MQIKTTAQLDAAFTFFSHTGSESFKLHEFEEACGVGMQSTAICYEIQLNSRILNLFICCFGTHLVVSAYFRQFHSGCETLRRHRMIRLMFDVKQF